MTLEIERRFDLNVPKFMHALTRCPEIAKTVLAIKQWYLTPKGVKPTFRIRETTDTSGKVTYLQTVKGKSVGRGSKPEIEFEISEQNAKELIQLAVYPVVEKDRYTVPGAAFSIEIDVYTHPLLKGNHAVEIEYREADFNDEHEWNFAIDEWLKSPYHCKFIGEEITDDGPSNRALAERLNEACEDSDFNWRTDIMTSPTLDRTPVKQKKKARTFVACRT